MKKKAVKQRMKQRMKQACSLILSLMLLAGAMPAYGEIRKADSREISQRLASPSDAQEKEEDLKEDKKEEEYVEDKADPENKTDVDDVPDKKPDKKPDKATPSAPKKQKQEKATPSAALLNLEQLSRVLVEDSFDDGDNWEVTNSSIVTFHDGQAHIKGGGANNRMGYKIGTINADDFLIELDLTLNEDNTNCNVKIGFKAVTYDGERLQLRFDYPKKKVYLEKTDGWSQSADFTGNTGDTYHIAILVEGNAITANVDGQELISVTKDGVSDMERGYFIVAGQYPKQDFSIDNLVISTDQQPVGEEYTVTLKTATNGETDLNEEQAGGTLRADKMSGYSGDTITLEPMAKHGYEFVKYESFKADGGSTDGLMPITNNKFQINEKFGNVTVVAHFKTREQGKFELFYDDFGLDTINAQGQYKTIGDESNAVPKNGELVLDAASGSNNYVLVDQSVFDGKEALEGYRISVDMRRGSGANGTMQIMFKGSDTDISNRYALVINTQGVVSFRSFYNGSNEELAKGSFTWPAQMIRGELEVKGNQAVFLVDGKEKLACTIPDGWNGLEDAAGLINMTGNAPMIFDNFMIERIPETSTVTVTSKYIENGVVKEDRNGSCGTARSSVKTVVEGDRVTLTALAKAGWKLKEYNAEDGLELTISDGVFTVPAGAPEGIRISAVFEPDSLRSPAAFYVDSENGDDSRTGTSEEEAWKTLKKLKDFGQMVPGDQILLKRGSKFQGVSLQFKGMGTEAAPIVIDAYGEGSLPRLDGQGEVENVISLFNQEYIEIRNLEITNTDPKYNSSFALNSSNNKAKALRAVNVSIKDFGTASGIVIDSLYIHDINGNINLKWNGGIFFDVQADVAEGELTGVPSKYDDIQITGCTFERVDRSAIKLVSSGWCNQWEKNSPGVPVNWYPSTNVVIRGNYLEKIGGDGITNRDTDGALIEYNLVRDCRYQNTGYNVGIWPFEASNTVIQYNEAYDTRGTQDGQGLDCDHASSYSVMQYNYSHNNEGGFMLIMGGYPHTAPTVRYNVSQNDRDKAFEFAQGIPNGTMIYNNTIYSDTTINRGILFLSNTGAGLGVNDMFLFNNLFSYPEGQPVYGITADTEKLKKAAHFYHNGYAGGMTGPEGEEGAVLAMDAGLKAPGTAPSENTTGVPRTGKSEELDGYKLTVTSPMIDGGVTIADAIAYFGSDELETVDGRAASPRELYDRAAADSRGSIAYVMGENFPEVDGVLYHGDFFVNENLAGTRPDIGAAEYGAKAIGSGGAETPGDPGTPDVPNIPIIPEDPSGPDTPDTPEDPGVPDSPDTPEEPDDPSTPENPSVPEGPNTSDGRDNYDFPRIADNSEGEIWDTSRSSQVNSHEDYADTPGNWNQTEDGRQFKRPDGTPYRDTWIYNGKKWYWAKTDGFTASGWQTINGVTYYFLPESGEMKTGWVREGDNWMYLDETGALLTNTVVPGGYQVDENGKWKP